MTIDGRGRSLDAPLKSNVLSGGSKAPPLPTLRRSREEDARARKWLLVSVAAFVAAALLLPLAGPAPLDLGRVWAGAEPDRSIFVQLRLSRTLLGLFAGAALALAGAMFQSMLRDALATPYTLGVSTGASLGAVIAITLGWHIVAAIPGIWAGALLGAAVALVVVVGAATSQRQVSAFGLLLAGVATNSMCSALILLVHGLAGMSKSFAISRWLIGSLDAIDYPALAAYIVLVIVLSFLVVRQARSWNLLAMGEAWAATRGAPVSRLLFRGYAIGSVLAASTVALTGPIGFIGLVVPHIVRSRVSADDRILMPCAFLLGGVLLASCDAIGRVILAPAEVPAGAITAFIGGPYLVWLVRHRS
jgi:iron complex transport system permease protein